MKDSTLPNPSSQECVGDRPQVKNILHITKQPHKCKTFCTSQKTIPGMQEVLGDANNGAPTCYVCIGYTCIRVYLLQCWKWQQQVLNLWCTHKKVLIPTWGHWQLVLVLRLVISAHVGQKNSHACPHLAFC